MSLTMDLYVLLGALLAVADDGSHLVVQNFCTTSRKGHQTGLSEALEDIERADGRPLGEVLDLNGGQRFDGHVRCSSDAAEERLVMFNPTQGGDRPQSELRQLRGRIGQGLRRTHRRTWRTHHRLWGRDGMHKSDGQERKCSFG